MGTQTGGGGFVSLETARLHFDDALPFSVGCAGSAESQVRGKVVVLVVGMSALAGATAPGTAPAAAGAAASAAAGATVATGSVVLSTGAAALAPAVLAISALGAGRAALADGAGGGVTPGI